MNQEPLGVAPDIVLPQNLERWSETNSIHNLTDYSAIGQAKHETSPFPYDPEINHKIILWWVKDSVYLIEGVLTIALTNGGGFLTNIYLPVCCFIIQVHYNCCIVNINYLLMHL